jgi:hypothetical protein
LPDVVPAALDPEPLLVEPELLLVDPELLLVVVPELEATVDAVDLDSAGSCPVTITMVISSQVATNSASEPATMRRRIIRTRPRRACLSACARARGTSAFMSVMVFSASRWIEVKEEAVGSFDPARIKGVSDP